MIGFTEHARERIGKRHADWTPQKSEVMADLAIKMGRISGGHNGCKRYFYMGHTWVINERNGYPVVVTVY